MPSEDAKAIKLKAEETAEDDDKSLNSILQARKKNSTNAGTLVSKSSPRESKAKVVGNNGDDFASHLKGKSSSVSRPKAVKVKKENEDNDDDNKPIPKKNSASKPDKLKELNKKKKKEEEKKGSEVTQQNGKKKQKKVYDLPGQKRDPPEERDPIRIFYESLYQQLPNSEMAQIWMMESGLLPKEEAKKVYEKKQKKNQQKLTSPSKGVVTTKKTQSATVKKQTPSPPISSIKRKTMDSKVETKQSKKRKTADGSDEEDSDEDFEVNRSSKKQRAS